MFTTIQLLIVVFALFALSRVFVKARSRSIPMVWALLWVFVWAAVLVVAFLPQTTDVVASVVGVGRGADLFVYLSIILLFYLVFRLFVKIESLQHELTKLVSELSIRDIDGEV